MWLRGGLKLFLLLFVVTATHFAGWACHELTQWSNYRRELSVGDQLRSELSAQRRSLDKMTALRNQQETAKWELDEHHERVDMARARLLGNDLTTVLDSERQQR